MIKLTIDGKTINAKENQTVLEVAIENGIYIPNLCYHPNLKPLAACRLCIIEIEKMKGFPTACTTIVSEGMIVKTNTGELQKLRKNLIWLILSNYPKEIPVSTDLKKVVDYVGVNEILKNYTPKERNLPIYSDDPLFIRDLDKCILCGRCVRMCQEVRGVGAIGLINRGIETFVGTTKNSNLKDSGCKFCRACVEVCPSGALVDKEEWREENKKEILIPCQHNCPAETDIPRYVRLIAEGRYQDSLAVIRSKFPFPYSLGLVCNHPCEEACSRTDVNEPISVRELKRFVAERDDGSWKKKLKIAKSTGKKVAIVGAGPSGLTAAWFLKLKGHDVTVFEMLPKPGGMLKAGIPDYRLPPNALESEIKEITNIGVKIKCNTKIDSTDKLFKEGFDAVYLAMGAPKGMPMGIQGEDDPRVLDGIETLRKINFEEDVNLKGDVGVVGGGNVAIDIARCALRIGAKKVKIIYRRTREEMPAYAHEIEDALDEGAEILFLTNPTKILKDKDKLKIECIKMQLGQPDSSGRRRPVPIDGSEFILELDRLILGIGQSCDAEGFDVELNKKGQVVVKEKLQETSKKAVFAGGDLVSGPATVIEAVQGGRLAAISIDKYLGGDGNIEQILYHEDETDPYIGRQDGFADRKRAKIKKINIKNRFPGFKQVELCLSEKDAIKEAERCLKCQLRLCIEKPPLPPKKKI